jgi:hypothetical protein
MRNFKDLSLYFLLAANLYILIQFHLGFIEVGAVIWTYWLQSLFMIITWAMRLAQLGYTKKGSAADLGFTMHVDRLVKPGFKTEFDYSGVSAFLLFGLGFFAMYGIALAAIIGPQTFLSAVPLSLGFGASHLVSFFQRRDTPLISEGKSVMTAFAQRLVPMHLTIILGAIGTGVALYVLIIAKTLLDLYTHSRQHSAE